MTAARSRPGTVEVAWVAVLAPVAVSLVTDSKPALAAAATLPVLWLLTRIWPTRHEVLAIPIRNAFFPFIVVYGLAGLIGVLVGLARANDTVLVAGQALPALLMVVGFLACGGVFVRDHRPDSWSLQLAGATVLLSLPALLPTLEWFVDGGDGTFVRFLGRSALFCPIAAILVLGLAFRKRPVLATALSGLLGGLLLLTFTRSYWLGAAIGVGFLVTGVLAARAGRTGRTVFGDARRHRARVRILAIGIALAVALAVTLTPLGPAFVERLSGKSDGGVDYSIAVRTFEWHAAWYAVQRAPYVGLGAGGKYRSLFQVGDDRVAYGSTNFIHNLPLYFPLKFGALGWAALAALVCGLGLAAASAFRDAWDLGDVAPTARVSALLVLVGASLTAPNLVDPVYATFVGVLARLGGEVSRFSKGLLPATTLRRGGVLGVGIVLVLGAGVSIGIAMSGVTTAPQEPKRGADLVRLAEAQARSPARLVTGLEIAAAGRGTPSGAILRWWQLIQFRVAPHDIAVMIAPRRRPRPQELGRKLRLSLYFFVGNKPRVVDERIDGRAAEVLAILGDGALSETREQPGTPYRFKLVRAGDVWRLANASLVDQRYRLDVAASK